MSLALAGGLFITEPPGKLLKSELILEFKSIFFSPMGLDFFAFSEYRKYSAFVCFL